MDILRHTLNNTRFSFDRATGALTELSHPSVRPMLQNDPSDGCAGLVDIAWPVHYEYETLRANPCGKGHPREPKIECGDGCVTIVYDALPQTYDAPEIEEQLAGRLSARIELRALDDGESVSLRCHVTNHSLTPVEQVVFPNFDGLIPTDTEESTRLTMMGGVINPFTYGSPRDMGGQFGPPAIRESGLTLTPSGIQTGPYIGRWYDWGGFRGGFSLYRRHWGWDAENPEKMGEADPIWIRCDARRHKTRIAHPHAVTLRQGETYDSGEYVLTAHAGPWIFGAQPYKNWLRAHVKRVVPMPRRAKEMLGFLTFTMANYPFDPTEPLCRYEDLPAIAADAAAHGLFDLNVWKAFNYTLPLAEDCFYKNWGGLASWNENVRKCRELGVTVTAFVSWLSLWSETCDNYGIRERSGTWAGSPHLLPRHCAPYAQKWACLQLWDHTHPRWKTDVLEGLRFLRDRAECPTISWDQYVLGDHSDNTLHDVINEYRLETEKTHPGAVWSAESTLFFESELDNTDYTWNGIRRRGGRWDWDFRPFMHIVGTMRPNMDVGLDPIEIKYALMDNLMLMLGLPSSDTGEFAPIADYPHVSSALKTCFRLRERYVDFFADGVPLGDCVLSQACEGAYVTAYRLENRLLLFILKEDDTDRALALNLSPFLGEGERALTVRGEADEVVFGGTIRPTDQLIVSAPAGVLRVAEIG